MSSPPTALSTSTPGRMERAFGVVEVVIAVLLIMTVVSGMVLAMTGSNKLRGASRLQVSMTTTGQRMIETLANENRWMEGCAAPRCAIAGQFDADDRKLEDVEGEVTVVGAAAGSPAATESHAAPIDSDVDGIGQSDEDGVIPDYYQVLLVIRPDADTISRYGGDATALTRRFTTAMDRDGNLLRGSLRVDACVVRNQADERMSIDGCNATGMTNLKMDGCPVNPPLTGEFASCSPAWDWVDGAAPVTPDTAPSPYVSLTRVPPSAYSFTIQNVSTAEPAIPSSQADVVNGSYVFKNITAGTYRISGLPGSFTVNGIAHPRWDKKELPTYHENPSGSVGVQPGIKNHALVMFRPPRTNNGIRFYFDRLVHHYELVTEPSVEKVGGPFAFDGQRWAPTGEYEGQGAAEFCKDRLVPPSDSYIFYDYSGGSTDDIQKAKKFWRDADYLVKYTRQCWVYKSDFATDNDASFCHVSSYRANMVTYDKDFREPDAQVVSSWDDPVEYTVTFCTYFRDELHHTSYRASQLPDTVLPGAVKSAVYEIAPRPTNREVEFGPGGGLVGARHPRMFCSVRGHTSHQNELDQSECQADGGMDRLLPGLNTEIMYPTDATVTTSGGDPESNPANAVENGTVQPRVMPGWARSGGLWVRTNGAVVSPQGGVGNPTINLRGDGECYWRGGPYLPQPWEGKCGGCNITWKQTVAFSNECAMLVKTCTRRYVLETRTQSSGWNQPVVYNGSTQRVDVYGPTTIAPQAGADAQNCIRYLPEWPCDARPASVTDGNCTPYQPPPPATVTLRPSTHDVSAGRTNVPQRNVTAQPGGG